MTPTDKRPLKIGIVCYPTTGGSGIVAVELAHALADRGHEVHVISYDVPVRLDTLKRNIRFHSVHVPDYPLFEYPPYSLALAAQLAQVICRHRLDVLHVHYAIPHAVSGWLARQISGRMRMPLVTTLHGTDITIIGKDASYLPVTRFSLESSDVVTVVSEWLCAKVSEVIRCSCDCEVVYNFVDPDRFRPSTGAEHPFNGGERVPVMLHMSNFRPVKRIPDVIDTFFGVRKRMHCRLVLIGSGPGLSDAESAVEASPYADDVLFLGPHQDTERVLPHADLFLFPSNAESFGLAALEAQACGVPVIGYRAGGLPEVVKDGETGRLFEVGDVNGMINAAHHLLTHPEEHRKMSDVARTRAVSHFTPQPVIERYEELYWQAIRQLDEQGGAKTAVTTPPCDDLVRPSDDA